MKRGMPTQYPGLYRTPTGFRIRAIGKLGSLTTEKAMSLPGYTEEEALEMWRRLKTQAQHEVRKQAWEKSQLEQGEYAKESADGWESQMHAPVVDIARYGQKWLEELADKVRSDRMTQKSKDEYVAKWDRFILPFFGSFLPWDVKPLHVVRWQRYLGTLQLPARRKGRGDTTYPQTPRAYSKQTLKRIWGTARVFFRWLTVQADLVRNPMEYVRFDGVGRAAREKTSLNYEEVCALLRAAHDENLRYHVMIHLALCGAMRFSELSALQWDDFDWENGAVLIQRSQVNGIVNRPKTANSRRKVVLPPGVLQLLRQYLAWQQQKQDVGLRRNLLFATQTGTYLGPKSFSKVLQRCALRAGINKRLSTHTLRRTANNRLRQEAGEVVAQEVTGHVTLEMTRLYSDVDRQERLQALQRAFGEGLEQARTTPPDGKADKN